MKRAHTSHEHTQGFTIVELIIYSGILIVFLYIMTSAFTSLLSVHLETESSGAVAQDSRYIFAKLQYDMSRAESILVPDSLGDQTTTLVLRIDGQDITYSLADGSLTVTSESGSDTLNGYGTRVSNLSFRRYGNVGGKHSIRTGYTLTSITEREFGAEQRDFGATFGVQ